MHRRAGHRRARTPLVFAPGDPAGPGHAHAGGPSRRRPRRVLAATGERRRGRGAAPALRHAAHRSPGWMIEAAQRLDALHRPGEVSATVKYGGGRPVSPGARARSWTPRRKARRSRTPSRIRRRRDGAGSSTSSTPLQKRRARSLSSAGNSINGAGMATEYGPLPVRRLPSARSGRRGLRRRGGRPGGRRRRGRRWRPRRRSGRWGAAGDDGVGADEDVRPDVDRVDAQGWPRNGAVEPSWPWSESTTVTRSARPASAPISIRRTQWIVVA